MGDKNFVSKRFLRWANLGNNQFADLLLFAVDSLVRPLEAEGFQWLERSFDVGTVPAHTINLERERTAGEIEYILIIFDKRHQARFQILFGAKQKSEPHHWVRAGALVWRKKSESVEYKWWGARWWNIDKERAMKEATQKAASFLPQVTRYLSEEVAGDHVWPSKIERQPIAN